MKFFRNFQDQYLLLLSQLNKIMTLCLPISLIIQFFSQSANYYPTLNARVEHIVSIGEACKRTKLPGAGSGELHPRNALLLPWSEVAVNVIGTWKITVTAQAIEFRALTCVDTVTNLPEISRINNKTSEYIAMKFENDWLAQYPRPEHCLHGNGGEFTVIPFCAC